MSLERMKQIIIEKYNPEWAKFFVEETNCIKNVAGDEMLDIYHIGSTSVPGLMAKPIIDMMLVTKSLEKTRQILLELQYRYKGEYNLPLHDMYGKSGKFEIYMHVYLVGNPEIKLNLMFRDYLRQHADARDKYAQIKIQASQNEMAIEKVETGITYYNVLKNDVLLSILEKTGFSEFCVRFVSQENERKFFNQLKNSNNFKNLDNSIKMVLYQGVKIVGAAEIIELPYQYFEINFVVAETSAGLEKLLEVIRNWVKIRKQGKFVESNSKIDSC